MGTKTELFESTHTKALRMVVLHTYSMQQSPSWEANRFSASREIPRILWNPKVITAFTSARHLSLSWYVGRTRVSVQVREFPCKYFVTGYVLRRGVVSTSPNAQAEGPPPVGCPRLLVLYIGSYPPYWRPFLHPQPKEAPCCGDRDPLITASG